MSLESVRSRLLPRLALFLLGSWSLPVFAGSSLIIPSDPPISIVVEEGVVLPALSLPGFDVPDGARIEIEIVGGDARFPAPFRRRLTEAVAVKGNLLLPRLIPGDRRFDQSDLRVLADRVPTGRALRVAVVPSGWVQMIASVPSFADGAILLVEVGYAVVDESRIRHDLWADDYSAHDSETEESHRHLPQALVWTGADFNPGDGDPDWCPGGCIRIPWGPGKVNWEIGNPWFLGWSVLPERVAIPGEAHLVPAEGPSQLVDGIYNRLWGCGVALKVPDSCTAAAATVFEGVECCCNHSMALLGHVCRFVGPGDDGAEAGWPRCPL